jgi:apolipoprotein N-acyltransferase
MKRPLLGALTGLLLVLSTAPVGLWWLAYVALVPLLFALDSSNVNSNAVGSGYALSLRQRVKRPLFIGFVAGFVTFLGTIYWVVNSMYFYGGLPIVASVPIMLVLVAYLALYPALFSLLFSLLLVRVRSACSVVLFSLVIVPALWVATEFLRGTLFTGFPWSLLGYSQSANLLLIQVADITGVWGVSYLVVAVNAALFLLARSLRARRARAGGVGTAIIPSVVGFASVLLLIVAVLVYGSFRIAEVDRIVAGWKSIKVAVAQGNIDQSVKWDESYRQKTLDIYARLSAEGKKQGARLVIWPETAVPFYLGERNPKEEIIEKIVDNAGVPVLTGAPSYKYNADTKGVEYLNSAYLFVPSPALEKGSISGVGLAQKYDKVHLVPYGEYVPLKRFFPFIKKLTVGVGDFASGPGPVPIAFKEAALGIVICYEVIFPKLSADTVEAGAGLLINITNDAWFGRSSAPYQHFEMALFRAVENRVTLLRSANTGISAVVDPVGRVVKRSGLFEEALIVENVAIKEGGLAFYTRHPDRLAYLSVGVSLLALIYSFARRRK